MPNEIRFSVHSASVGKDFTVRVVQQGQAYGRDMASVRRSPDPLIEFYDAEHPHARDTDGKTLGQFVSRYFLSTLLKPTADGTTAFTPGNGLCLDGGVPAWTLDAAAVQDVHRNLVALGLAPPPAAPHQDFDRLERALEQAGLPGLGVSRDQAFHEAMGELADRVIQDIESGMGGAMPEHAKTMLYLVIERAANLTGPQLEVIHADDSPSP